MFCSRLRPCCILMFYVFCRLIFRCHTVAKHTPTRSATVARPLRCPPLPRASSSGLLLLCFYWRPPNAWAPSPSLFLRCVAFRQPKQPPQRELNDIAHARCCARCYELTRRAGSGGGKRRGRNGCQRAMGGGVLYFTSKMLPLWSPLHEV